VGDEVVEISSVVRLVCVMPCHLTYSNCRGGGGGGGQNSDAAIVRSSKLDRCLEMKISDLLDLASCIPFYIGNKAFLI
jgi:hypothetical protein